MTWLKERQFSLEVKKHTEELKTIGEKAPGKAFGGMNRKKKGKKMNS